MKSSICLFIICAATLSLFAQDVKHDWSVSWGNAEAASSASIAVDQHSNVFVAGTFTGTIDFDPGPGMSVFTSGFSGFGSDSYVCKYDSNGQFQWVRTWTASIGIHKAIRIIWDEDGFLYVTGYFTGTCDFDPGPGVFNLTGTGSTDELYIMKLDPEGQLIWAIATQGQGNKYARTMTIDNERNIVLGGIFTGTADFDPGPGKTELTSTAFLDDLFFAKYDHEGKLVWAQASIGSSQGSVNGVGTDDDGNIYFGGSFDDRRDFDPGVDSVILQASGIWDAYLLKLDKDGQYQWIHHLGNLGDNWIHDVLVNNENQIYVGGYFSDELDFDPGTNEKILSATNSDPFIWKLDSAGALIWVASFPGVSFDQTKDLELDHLGNVYATGFFAETVDFDPGPGTHLITCTGDDDLDDVFAVMLNSNGEFVWAYAAGGLGNDGGAEIKVDSNGHIFITGVFNEKAGFFPDHDGTDSLVSAGVSDVFLTHWTQCLSTFNEYGVLSCLDQFTSPSGKYVWTESGTYRDTIQNVAGCDSILTIHLTISDLGLTITQSGNELIGEGGGQLFWIDCDHNNEQVGDGPTFTPPHDGNYALVGIGFACTDTSECFSFVMTGTEEIAGHADFELFPNPAHHSFEVDLHRPYSKVQLVIFNQFGLPVMKENFSGQGKLKVVTDFPSGLYLVSVITGDKRQMLKVVVE